MRAETTTAAPGENAIGCGNVYRGNVVGFLVLGCAPMMNRDICIAVPTYRSVNKCVHYTSVLIATSQNKARKTYVRVHALVRRRVGACKYHRYI